MSAVSFDFPVAPHLQMPLRLQLTFLYATIAATIVVLGFALHYAVKQKTWVPIFLVVAGGASILLEPLCTFLGHAVHPQSGSIDLFKAVDRNIPWHIFFGYMACFGLINLIMYKRVAAGTLTRRYAWTVAIANMAYYAIVEISGVTTGLWRYYDYQPLWVMKITAPPLWWVLNVSSEFAAAALILAVIPRLRPWQIPSVLVLAPMGAVMGHLGPGCLWYNVVNTAAAPWVMELVGCVTFALALYAIGLSIRLMMAFSRSSAAMPSSSEIAAI